ncbi:hypothetical protein C8F01DRAFT_1254308 [Mycena amicta]|nr:hypothetical protein C8F01DRAFT_1254308 [Mycena amicta]
MAHISVQPPALDSDFPLYNRTLLWFVHTVHILLPILFFLLVFLAITSRIPTWQDRRLNQRPRPRTGPTSRGHMVRNQTSPPQRSAHGAPTAPPHDSRPSTTTTTTTMESTASLDKTTTTLNFAVSGIAHALESAGWTIAVVTRTTVQLIVQSIRLRLYMSSPIASRQILPRTTTIHSSRSSETLCFSYTVAPEWENVPHDQLQLGFTPEGDWDVLEDDDEYVIYPVEMENTHGRSVQAFTMYKRVDKKIRPVSTTFSPEYEVKRQIPEDPALTQPELSRDPPEFIPTERITKERLALLEVNADGFLSTEEEKLILDVLRLNEQALAFEDRERGTFRDDYFSPYKIATVPHVPWEYKNIPIPPGILEKVIDTTGMCP